MFLSFCGKFPRDEGAVFVAPNATVQGDVVLRPGSTVWYGAVLRGDDGTLTIGENTNVQDIAVLAAVICIEDPLRPEARDVIRGLHELGVEHLVMMTGDNEKTARAVAAAVGVDAYYAGVLPEDKANFIRREHDAGRKVIMIGDGVNDSPALSEADAGSAISDGAAIARDLFGVSDEIYWAIYWHTTGKADMTKLEKVIYLADYIEPSRDFPGVEKLRRAVHADLEHGLLMALEDSIEETLTYCDFPSEHWTRIRTNNVIERLNREIRRRTRVVGSFPDGNSALMLVCARLRHVAGTQWGSKKYMNMKHLEAAVEDASIAG